MENIVVVGGGAAGIFGAIAFAQGHLNSKVILLEKTNTLLAKVRISGGGRCNVTHACFDPQLLAKNYPRGNKALIGPFHQFQPKNTIQWFEDRGVHLKTEGDGRMFPITDNSQTIIDCLLDEAKRSNVEIRLRQSIKAIEKVDLSFRITLSDDVILECNKLLLATGSGKDGYAFAQSLGHTIVSPVPSLFTFNLANFPLTELAGVSMDKVIAKIAHTDFVQAGPLLITHWGFSGPAILKLSAWGARALHDVNYQANLIINWLPDWPRERLLAHMQQLRSTAANRAIINEHGLPFPRQLWKKLLELSSIDPNTRLRELSNKQLMQLIERLTGDTYSIVGKTTYKQEFVTAGGINLDEVNFKTMESKICPNLYFAGEILDIDGVTGGFNFQSAWTTAWIAGQQGKKCH